MARSLKVKEASRKPVSAGAGGRMSALTGELPHNLGAEVSVLGSMVLNNDTIDVVGPMLRPGSFFAASHQKIFSAMLSLHEQRRAVDLVTLGEELERAGDQEFVGGPEYLVSLVDAVPAAANVEHYAEIVQEKSFVRELLGVAREIFDAASSKGVRSRELLDEAESKIFHIAEQGMRSAVAPIREVIKDTFERIDKMRGLEGMVTGLATGFPDLDEITSGLQEGELIILAARPSMGKTTLALNILKHAGVNLHEPAVIFSMEMSREQLARNMLCSHAGIDSHSLRRGRLSPNQSQKLSFHVGALSEAPIYIDDTPGLNPFELRAKVRRLKAADGCKLVVVDYLQLMEASGGESRQMEIAYISRSLKGLAREMNIPVVAVSQLNRQLESRDDKRPRMADLRESGSLEQDADVVLLLHRESYFNHNKDDHSAELIVAKQRNGPTGVVNLTFLNRFLRFENSTEGVRVS